MELSGFFNMDCMEGMKQMPDKYFELAIVDPPYGIGASEKIVQIKSNQRNLLQNQMIMEIKIGTMKYLKKIILTSCLELVEIK